MKTRDSFTQNLLISEPPLQVLPSLAVKVGLNEAIVLQQFHYWLQRSTNVKDGYKWIYNSYPEWNKQFPFWSLNTLKRAIHRLEKNGYLISGNYNRAGFDKTKWYRINYEKMWVSQRSSQNGSTINPNWDDGSSQNGLTNTNRLPENTSINKKTLRQKHKNRVYDKDSDYYKLSEFFVKQILTNNPNFKNPNIQKWSDDFRKIIELDGRDKHQVAKLIVWVQHDSFWFSNILSPAKLRDKYDQLVMRMSPSISEQRGSNSKEHISNKENDLKDKLKKEAEKKIKENEKENAARRTRIMQGSAEQA